MEIKDGYYIWKKGENEWMGKYFRGKEFQCHCENKECDEQKISVDLIDRLTWLREASNSPMRIHSAFRCKKQQEDIRNSGQSTVVATGTSSHELGNAADVSVSALVPGELLKLAEHKFKSVGIAINFLHLDLRDDKVRRWKY